MHIPTSVSSGAVVLVVLCFVVCCVVVLLYISYDECVRFVLFFLIHIGACSIFKGRDPLLQSDILSSSSPPLHIVSTLIYTCTYYIYI